MEAGWLLSSQSMDIRPGKAEMEQASISTGPVQSKEQILEHSDQPTDAEINDIAKKLLQWKLLLSALEIHAELCERGRELPVLRDFFSNPGNFELHTRFEPAIIGGIRRSASNLTLDSIDDFSRYSDDAGRETDEKVAVLEFELRRAKETIKELRENITEYAKENEASLASTEKEISLSSDHEEPLKPFESRALNFLTSEYLLKNEYRLTAVTFGEEVGDQDLDDWDDVGVNISRPPNLLHLFRDYGKHVIGPIEADKEEIERLKQQIYNLESDCKRLAEEVDRLGELNANYQDELISLQSKRNGQDVSESPSSTTANSSNIVSETVSVSPTQDVKQPERLDTPVIIIDEHDAATQRTIDDAPHAPADEQLGKTDSEGLSQEDSASVEGQLDTLDAQGDNQSEDSFLNIDTTSEDDLADDQAPRQAADHLLEVKCSSKRKISAAFLQTLFGLVQRKTDSRLNQEIINSADSEDALQVVARCLPNVVPNVLLNKREELIPIILCIVRLHDDVKVRDALLHMLFNLIKRPDEEQRKMIIDGFVAFAKKVGPTRIEAELLPQCWEQISHKYPERRLLVAETCGCVAPYIPAELLSSLMFSMLKQIIEDDRSEKVREAATRSFALTLAFVDDENKYSQAIHLLMKTLLDSCESVSEVSRQMLLPVIGIWTLELGTLHTHLLTPLWDTVKSLLEDASKELTVDESDENYNNISQTLDLHFKILFGCLIDLVPLLFVFVMQTAPFHIDETEAERFIKDNRIPRTDNALERAEIIFGDDRKLSILIDNFDKHFEHRDTESWDTIDWVCEKCLSQTCQLTGLRKYFPLEIMEQLVCFLCNLCRTFGREFTYKKIIPHFEKLMRATELPFLSDGISPICSPLLPLFVCGVLSVFTEEEDRKRLCTFVKQALVTISTQNLPLHNLKQSFQILCFNIVIQTELVQVLREALVHPSTVVRMATAPLLEILVPIVGNDSLFSQVASALITLSNDREFIVKVATVSALGTIVETRTDKNLLDKICLQLQSLMDDPGLKDNIQLQKTLLRTFSRIIPNSDPKFREDFLAHRIRRMVEENSLLADLKTQVDMARELTQCLKPRYVVEQWSCYYNSMPIIPALRYLERDMRELAPDVFETVSTMIIDAERKVVVENDSAGSLAHAKDEMKSKLLSGFSRLKDASQKKRDIFRIKKDRSSTMN
eukprot:gene19013-20925_t